jgi:hypothetical protein
LNSDGASCVPDDRPAPLVDATIAGKRFGEVASVAPGKVGLHVTVRAASWISVHQLTVLGPGDTVLATRAIPSSTGAVRFDDTIELDVARDGYAIVRARRAPARGPRRSEVPALHPRSVDPRAPDAGRATAHGRSDPAAPQAASPPPLRDLGGGHHGLHRGVLVGAAGRFAARRTARCDAGARRDPHRGGEAR